MIKSSLRFFAVLSLAVLPPFATGEESSPLRRTLSLDYAPGTSTQVEIQVGDLRVSQFGIKRDAGPLIQFVETPRGAKSRWSWTSYSLFVENPTAKRARVGAKVRLLDGNGAVVDEFEFSGTIWRGRSKTIDLKRLTLNYAIPLIKKVEIEISASP